MQNALVDIHSFWRWVVLLVLTVALLRGLAGWLRGGAWSGFDRTLLQSTVGALDLQLILGITIWILGRHWTSETFVAVTHPLVMIAAIAVAHAGSVWIKRISEPVGKYRALTITIFLALFLITAAIPPDAWRKVI